MIYTQHLGIYGIIRKENYILLIKKSRGPYTGKLDLPGGRPEHGETIETTLKREVYEETGLEVINYNLYTNYTAVINYVTPEQQAISFYHIGLLYCITHYSETNSNQTINYEDSLGWNWYNPSELNVQELTPFAEYIIKTICSK
jgi:8-oxo-dGTP diphosphatase